VVGRAGLKMPEKRAFLGRRMVESSGGNTHTYVGEMLTRDRLAGSCN
jgi:hypothetical protein